MTRRNISWWIRVSRLHASVYSNSRTDTTYSGFVTVERWNELKTNEPFSPCTELARNTSTEVLGQICRCFQLWIWLIAQRSQVQWITIFRQSTCLSITADRSNRLDVIRKSISSDCGKMRESAAVTNQFCVRSILLDFYNLLLNEIWIVRWSGKYRRDRV